MDNIKQEVVLGFLGLDLWEPLIDSSKSEVPLKHYFFLVYYIRVIITALRENRKKLEKVLRKRRN